MKQLPRLRRYGTGPFFFMAQPPLLRKEGTDLARSEVGECTSATILNAEVSVNSPELQMRLVRVYRSCRPIASEQDHLHIATGHEVEHIFTDVDLDFVGVNLGRSVTNVDADVSACLDGSGRGIRNHLIAGESEFSDSSGDLRTLRLLRCSGKCNRSADH